MSLRAYLILPLVGLLTVSCAPVSKLPQVDAALAEREALKQRELAIRGLVDNETRLINIAFPILRDNVELCGEDIAPGTGMNVANKRSFPREFHEAAENVLGIADRPQVLVVARNSPADRAGLMPGDVLTAIDDWSVPVGRDSVEKVDKHFRENKQGAKTVTISYLRGGTKGAAVVEPVDRCDFGLRVVSEEQVNAFADGENVIVSTGMMRFAASDDELAIVVGHEVAHNLMGHLDKTRGNAAIGFVFDLLFAGFGVNTQGAFSNLAAGAYSIEFEAEADYVGLYLIARSGIPIADAPNFWRRMGVAYPSSIQSSHVASHPTSPHRFVTLDLTVKEIEEKRAAGEPLLPEKGYKPLASDDAQPSEPPPGS